jgi:hypothetical protein
MEGNYELDYFFKEYNCLEDLYDVLPFSHYDDTDDKNDFMLDLLKIDFTPSYHDHKHEGNSEDILIKLNEIEANYNNIIQDNIVSSPTISTMSFN